MITRQRRRSFWSRLWFPLLAAAVLGYFGYHAFDGSFGVWEMMRLKAEAARLAVAADELRAEHAALEKRVATLRPGSLDADVVDIEARASLNVMRPDEVVISFGAVQQPAR